MTATRALVWLRRDLRLADNPALDWARRHADEVGLVYIHEPAEEGAWGPGGASRWWLNRSLASLTAALERRGLSLLIRRGPALDVLCELIASTGAQLVCWNRLYEPAVIARDKRVKAGLRADGIDVQSFNAALLFEPWEIETADGGPYRVFTPYWRTCQQRIDALPTPLPVPPRATGLGVSPGSLALDALDLAPRIAWDAGLADRWTPGESGAQAALARVVEETVERYPETRNRPDLPGTSRLSPHLHFGELSPRQILAALRGPAAAQALRGTEAFLRQVGWREFAHHLLYHYPDTPETPLDARFAGYPWEMNRAALRAWQRGVTGYPIVDAGMRELWRTGWMHNRVRMVVASFLTKNLRIHWLEGARWFWDTLVDADLANNTLGWQWTAGCGADAAPYVRVFNPVLQSERHDPARAYLRRWLPELARLPDEWIHRPWAAPADVLATAGVALGSSYPEPIVDLRASRAAALEGFEDIRQRRR